MENLTELEKKVIEVLKYGDLFDEMPCDGIENLSDETGLNTTILRGVLSSLIKKDIVRTGEFPNGKTAFYYYNNGKIED